MSQKSGNTLKVVHISDTHGKHQELCLPEGDVLIHSGDFSVYAIDEETESFLDWFRNQNFKHKILIAGNHDRTLFESRGFEDKQFNLKDIVYLSDHSLTGQCLVNDMRVGAKQIGGKNSVVIDGFTFYGSAWTPSDFQMSFTYYPGEGQEFWEKVPRDVDVLITHGPAKGMLDNDKGCLDLAERMSDLNIKAHLFGHIHEAKGQEVKNGVIYSNAAESINVFTL